MTETAEQTHYGVTEMAEVFGKRTGRCITKQAMSARMDTKLFKEKCTVESTGYGRIVPVDQVHEYIDEWVKQNA